MRDFLVDSRPVCLSQPGCVYLANACDRKDAQALLADENFGWYGGIVVFQVGNYLEEMTAHRADIAELAQLHPCQ